MENKIIPTIIITLSITTYLICIFILSRWYVQNERNKKFAESLNESTEIISKEEQDKDTINNNTLPNGKYQTES